jgi:hypothetical protein
MQRDHSVVLYIGRRLPRLAGTRDIRKKAGDPFKD